MMSHFVHSFTYPVLLSKDTMKTGREIILKIIFFHDVTFRFIAIAIIGMKVIESGWVDGCLQPTLQYAVMCQ